MRLLTPCRGCTSSFLPTSTPDSKDFCQFSLSVHSHYLTLHLSCCFIMSSPIISPHSISIPVFPINLALDSPFSLNCWSLCVSPIKGYRQRFSRRWLRSSHHLLSSCRYWAQLCSENRPWVWSTTKQTSVLQTAMRLLCCSHRSGLFYFFLLTLRWWKSGSGCNYSSEACSCIQHTIITILVCFNFCAPDLKAHFAKCESPNRWIPGLISHLSAPSCFATLKTDSQRGCRSHTPCPS